MFQKLSEFAFVVLSPRLARCLSLLAKACPIDALFTSGQLLCVLGECLVIQSALDVGILVLLKKTCMLIVAISLVIEVAQVLFVIVVAVQVDSILGHHSTLMKVENVPFS